MGLLPLRGLTGAALRLAGSENPGRDTLSHMELPLLLQLVCVCVKQADHLLPLHSTLLCLLGMCTYGVKGLVLGPVNLWMVLLLATQHQASVCWGIGHGSCTCACLMLHAAIVGCCKRAHVMLFALPFYPTQVVCSF